MDRQTTIERLEEMEQWLLDKSYSDLRARDHYEIVGAAIDLLKEQEPQSLILEKEYFEDDEGDEVEYKVYLCPKCGAHCSMLDHFCSNCGRAVKWDADG